MSLTVTAGYFTLANPYDSLDEICSYPHRQICNNGGHYNATELRKQFLVLFVFFIFIFIETLNDKQYLKHHHQS